MSVSARCCHLPQAAPVLSQGCFRSVFSGQERAFGNHQKAGSHDRSRRRSTTPQSMQRSSTSGAAATEDAQFQARSDGQNGAHAPQDIQPLPEGEQLVQWIRDNGGYVNESLALAYQTDCGVRGIITRQPLLGEDATLPLVIVPEALYMTAIAADEILSPRLAAAGRPPLRDLLNPGLQLAVLLAHERRLGRESFWAPYIESLPAQPPCPWLLPPDAVASQLDQIDLSQQERQRWMQEVQQAARHGMQQAAEAAAAVAPAVSIAAEDVAWGMGQIASRAFGSGADIGMAPYIDLMNHADEAVYPQGVVDEENLPPGVHYCVASIWNGRPRELQAGQELFISYQVMEHAMTPLNVFLNFGLAPPLLATSARVTAATHKADVPSGKPMRGAEWGAGSLLRPWQRRTA